LTSLVSCPIPKAISSSLFSKSGPIPKTKHCFLGKALCLIPSPRWSKVLFFPCLVNSPRPNLAFLGQPLHLIPSSRPSAVSFFRNWVTFARPVLGFLDNCCKSLYSQGHQWFPFFQVWSCPQDHTLVFLDKPCVSSHSQGHQQFPFFKSGPVPKTTPWYFWTSLVYHPVPKAISGSLFSPSLITFPRPHLGFFGQALCLIPLPRPSAIPFFLQVWSPSQDQSLVF